MYLLDCVNINSQLRCLEKKKEKELSRLENMDMQLRRCNFHNITITITITINININVNINININITMGITMKDMVHHYYPEQEEKTFEEKRKRVGKKGLKVLLFLLGAVHKLRNHG